MLVARPCGSMRVQMKNNAHKNSGRQGRPRRRPSNLTIPVDLRERLRALSEATGIPQSRIAEQGIRIRLAQIEHAQRAPERTP
ncbi:ribbon-helix-helix domain-containing protein [Sorangium sp. So ce327]|uniref:ribbon-helix-helix domain-containing protein n=1 Tax=Sorangium sp. So ce327 TaxID=3133301 RepID=UPI003F5F39BA